MLDMKKLVLTLTAVLVAVTLFMGACSRANDTPPESDAREMTVTDSLGRTVTVPVQAERFIAIGPGCLRLYCYVGDVSKIVGVEQIEITNGVTGRPYAMAYPELLAKPVIGPGGPNNTPDAEKILEVEPDVIFSLYNSDVSSVDELQSKTHIPVVALSYGDTEVFDPALNDSLTLIGRITGNEDRAVEVIQLFAGCQEDLDARTAGIAFADKPAVYMGAQSSRGTHGIESTTGSYSLFTAVNVRNVVEEAGIHEYVMLDKEMLLEMDPDIIFIDGGGLANVQEDYMSSPQFYQGLSAFKTGRVYMMLPYNYYYANIDIALCDAYYIGSIVYPEKFSDIDIVVKSNEIFEELLGKELYSEVAGEYYGGFQQLSFSS
jgi:iron complex transport system substrate-binding protein